MAGFAFLLFCVLDCCLYKLGISPFQFWILSIEVAAMLLAYWKPYIAFHVCISVFLGLTIGGFLGLAADLASPAHQPSIFEERPTYRFSYLGAAIGFGLGFPLTRTITRTIELILERLNKRPR
jgi:hypothetical protein